LITPTISNNEAAMQQIIITYMKNLSSVDQKTTPVRSTMKILQIKD